MKCRGKMGTDGETLRRRLKCDLTGVSNTTCSNRFKFGSDETLEDTSEDHGSSEGW